MHEMRIPGVRRVEIMPIPPIDDNTEYFPAGPVTIGVEWRHLDAEMVMAEFKKQNRPKEEIPDPAHVYTEEGVSFHVMGDVDGKMVEYIRFDCLAEGPHYHYICYARDFKDDTNHAIVGGIDPLADGEAIPWALERLETRLPKMLAFAGRGDLASQIEGSAEYKAALPNAAARAKSLVANPPF
jgi:hypothetical protein